MGAPKTEAQAKSKLSKKKAQTEAPPFGAARHASKPLPDLPPHPGRRAMEGRVVGRGGSVAQADGRAPSSMAQQIGNATIYPAHQQYQYPQNLMHHLQQQANGHGEMDEAQQRVFQYQQQQQAYVLQQQQYLQQQQHLLQQHHGHMQVQLQQQQLQRREQQLEDRQQERRQHSSHLQLQQEELEGGQGGRVAPGQVQSLHAQEGYQPLPTHFEGGDAEQAAHQAEGIHGATQMSGPPYMWSADIVDTVQDAMMNTESFDDVDFLLNSIMDAPASPAGGVSVAPAVNDHVVELDMAAAEAAAANAFENHAAEQPLDAAPLVAEAAAAAATARVMAAQAEIVDTPLEYTEQYAKGYAEQYAAEQYAEQFAEPFAPPSASDGGAQPSSAPEADREGDSESESAATDTNKLPLPLPPPSQRVYHGGRSGSRRLGMMHMREREVWQQSKLVIDLLAAMQAAISEEPDWRTAAKEAKAVIGELTASRPKATAGSDSAGSFSSDSARAGASIAALQKISAIDDELQETMERLLSLSAASDSAGHSAEVQNLREVCDRLKAAKGAARAELASLSHSSPSPPSAGKGETSGNRTDSAEHTTGSEDEPRWMESASATSALLPATACRALQLKLIDVILDAGFEQSPRTGKLRDRLDLLSESVLSEVIHGILRRWQALVSEADPKGKGPAGERDGEAEGDAPGDKQGDGEAGVQGTSEVAQRLFSFRGKDGAGALHLASALGDDAAIAAMLRAGAKVDGVDSRGCAPLHWAAAYGREEALALLLAAGADPGQPAGEEVGTTPADLAAAQGHGGIAAYLAEAALNQSLGALHLSKADISKTAQRSAGAGVGRSKSRAKSASVPTADHGGKSDGNEQYYQASRRRSLHHRRVNSRGLQGAMAESGAVGTDGHPDGHAGGGGDASGGQAEADAEAAPATRKRGRGRATDESGTDNNGGLSRGMRAAAAVAGMRAATATRGTVSRPEDREDIESEVEALNAAAAAERAAQTIQSAFRTFRMHRQRRKRRPRYSGNHGGAGQGPADKSAWSDGDEGDIKDAPQAARTIQQAYRLHRQRRQRRVRRAHSAVASGDALGSSAKVDGDIGGSANDPPAVPAAPADAQVAPSSFGGASLGADGVNPRLAAVGGGAAAAMAARAASAGGDMAQAAAAAAVAASAHNSGARLAMLDRAVTRVQAIVRSRQARTQYLRLRGAVVQLQGALRQRALQKRRKVVQGDSDSEERDSGVADSARQ
uniref:Uncharacterized protein n=1 Tax=Prasinoderma coloniale TaxID=156133 RepID=A0A7R9TFW4_9VIRI